VESLVAYWLRWPSLEYFVTAYRWAWPLMEILHFFGLILLFGAVGTFDLRLLGVGKGLPLSLLSRLLPWGMFGFGLCVASGSVFVGGIVGNVGTHPYEVLTTNIFLQLKLLFIFLAGLNLLAFYLTGMARLVATLGPGEDAPPLAKLIGGTSLALWIGVIYVGRLIPWAL
jgi:hypothetical protein